MRRRAFLASTATAAVPLVAGCGGGSGDGDGAGGAYGGGGGGSTTEADDGSGDGMVAHTEYPDYDWSQLEDASATETAEVTLSNFEFQPLIARVSAGTEVTFANEDSAGHTVTIPALDVDEQIGGGESTTVAVEEAGTYDYVCAFHPPDMLGRLVVE